MKKRFVAASLAAMMVLSMTACGGGNTATTAAPAETKAEETTAAEAKEESKEEAKESEASAEKAPEDYTGTVVVYSPHDADPLNAGVNLFMEKYPNVKVEVVAAGTGELCNRIAAESANPIADVQMAAIDKIVIQTYYTNMSKKYSEVLTHWLHLRIILHHMCAQMMM